MIRKLKKKQNNSKGRIRAVHRRVTYRRLCRRINDCTGDAIIGFMFLWWCSLFFKRLFILDLRHLLWMHFGVCFSDCHIALCKFLQYINPLQSQFVIQNLWFCTNCHTISNAVFAGVAGNMCPRCKTPYPAIYIDSFDKVDLTRSRADAS